MAIAAENVPSGDRKSSEVGEHDVKIILDMEFSAIAGGLRTSLEG